MVQRKVVYRAPRFDVEQVVEKLQDGRELPRTIIRHPGAVVILPVLDDGRVCMIETYRVAIDRWHLELPAGTMDKGVRPIELAAMELQEETGYVAEELVLHELLTWSQIDLMLRDGQIADAKTLVGLLWYLRYRQYA